MTYAEMMALPDFSGRVSIEYTPVPCGGKKPKENDDGFAPGCALKLYSITVLEMTNESVR